MAQFLEPRQNSIGQFPTLQVAQSAFERLQQAGFSAEQMSLVPQSLDPHPNVDETDAARSAGGGAIAGAGMGGIVGLLLGYISIYAAGISHPQPLSDMLGITLAASGIGAAGGSVIAALTGANINKASEPSTQPENYLLLIDGTPEELAQAQTILGQQDQPVE